MNPRFLLFKASAGSGKTFNLAVQYITLLVAHGADEYRHTLAVTFTNKATAEMKQRIVEQLYGIANHLHSSEGYIEHIQKELREKFHLTISDEELRKRCGDALHRILHDYGRFSVSTIDAFFQTVMRNMAHELGLNARLQVDLDTQKLQDKAVDDLIDGLQPTDTKMLRWIENYAGERMEAGNRWDFRDDLKTLASWLFKEVFLKRNNNMDIPDGQEENKSFETEHIEAYRKKLIERQKVLMEDLDEFETVLESNGYSYEDGVQTVIRTYIANLRQGKNISINPTLQNLLDSDDPSTILVKKGLKNTGLAELAATLHPIVKKLPAIRKELETIKAICKNLTPMALLGAIEREILRINQDNNTFSLSHTPVLLSSMVEEGDAPFIFEKMGAYFRHVMIDEFQDTSQLQWRNFCVLLLNALSEGNLCMVVGDVKQSIYRWRNGDWHTLNNLSNSGLPNTQLDQRTLDTNFRSQQAIVDFNNVLFPKAAELLDNYGIGQDGSTLTNIYDDVRQNVKKGNENGGFVQIKLRKPKEKKDEVEQKTDDFDVLSEMCNAVARLHKEQKIPYNKMAILVRTKTCIHDIINAFAVNLPEVQVISDEAFRLSYSPAVNIIITALQAINELRQEVPSPLPLRTLQKAYAQQVCQQDFAPSSFCSQQPEDLLPPEFVEHMGELAQMPLYELCEKIYRILSLCKIEKQDNYMFSFFDNLAAYLRDNPSDISAFLEFWDDRMSQVAIPMGNVDGIRIVTVHTSKGLQYHTVLMPYCDWKLEDDKNYIDNFLWCWPQSESTSGIGMLPVKLGSALGDTEFSADYAEEHFQQRTDELNALYVAFTRAEHNLLAWGVMSKPTQKDPTPLKNVADLISQCMPMDDDMQYISGTPAIYQNKHEDSSENRLCPDMEVMPIEMVSYEGRIEFRQSRPAAEFAHLADKEEDIDQKQLTYIEKGKLLHYIFSKIDKADEVERVADEMLERGVLANVAQRNEVLSLAKRGMKNDIVASWFNGNYKLFNECSILNINDTGDTVKHRPDRVMITDDRIIVVDYKFGKPNSEHDDQVKHYLQLLSDMQRNGKKRDLEGWLWYVYSKNDPKKITL